MTDIIFVCTEADASSGRERWHAGCACRHAALNNLDKQLFFREVAAQQGSLGFFDKGARAGQIEVECAEVGMIVQDLPDQGIDAIVPGLYRRVAEVVERVGP